MRRWPPATSPFIRTTDVADLSFLPVGKAMGGYTGTISPAAVRRLVDEARKHFDVILIDTGPILGSIEASPVAVAADGVVLCVSRGQQRQLVDRRWRICSAIGAQTRRGGLQSGAGARLRAVHQSARFGLRPGRNRWPPQRGHRSGGARGGVIRAVSLVWTRPWSLIPRYDGVASQ